MAQSGSVWVSMDQCGSVWVGVYGLIWLGVGSSDADSLESVSSELESDQFRIIISGSAGRVGSGRVGS